MLVASRMPSNCVSILADGFHFFAQENIAASRHQSGNIQRFKTVDRSEQAQHPLTAPGTGVGVEIDHGKMLACGSKLEPRPVVSGSFEENKLDWDSEWCVGKYRRYSWTVSQAGNRGHRGRRFAGCGMHAKAEAQPRR